MFTLRKIVVIACALGAPLLTTLAARPAMAQQYSVRADAGAAFHGSPTVSYSNTPGAVATNSAGGVSFGGSTGDSASRSAIGNCFASGSISQPSAGGDPKVTVGGVNASAKGSFTDTLLIGGAPGSLVLVRFNLGFNGGVVTPNVTAMAHASLTATSGNLRGSAVIEQRSGVPGPTGNHEFSLTVPAGSRIYLTGNASISLTTPTRSGSRVSYEGSASAGAVCYVTASAPVASLSGYVYPTAP